MNASEVDPIIPCPCGALVVGGHGSHGAERKYSAGAAEEMIHVLVPELVELQVLGSFDLDIRWAEVVRGHDGPFADADGAVASSAGRDLRTREPETHRAAMATGAVSSRRLHGPSPYHLPSSRTGPVHFTGTRHPRCRRWTPDHQCA